MIPRLLLALLAVSFGLLNLAFSVEAEHPNVIFILADDLGWADTTLYGRTKYYQTPNLERLAKRGVTFTRAYSASPLCSPTRSAVLTGLSPARTGITTPNCHLPQTVLETTQGKSAAADKKAIPPVPPTRLKPEYRTLAESLKDAGYATGHFGKWHLGPEPYSPLQQGFDVDLPHHPGPGPAGSYVAPWKFKDFDHDPNLPDQHIEDRMAQEAVAFIERHKEEPFFLNYWMFSVHAPFDAKKALVEEYRVRADPKDAQRSPTYAAMVESMDDAIGTLLDTLERLKLAEKTIIIFTSDNGGNMYSEVDGGAPTSNAPLRGGKASMFEGGTRVPCVIAWPGITAAGSRCDAIIQSEDYYPTLLDGLGLSPLPDRSFDGTSIMPALKGQAFDREAVFQYFPHDPPVPDWIPPSVSVHRGDWKLIRVFHGGDKFAHRYLLFNLREDLSESSNLAAANPGLVVELDSLISDFLIRTKAVVPVPNPAFDPSRYRPELEGIRPPAAGAKSARARVPADAPTKDKADAALKGWKARSCTAKVSGGIASITNINNGSFLGFPAGQHRGASTVKLRIKSGEGAAHVDWLPGGVQDKAHSVPLSFPGGDWQEIEVKLAATGPLGVVRVYLPQQKQPVEIDWIEITSAGDGKTTRSDF